MDRLSRVAVRRTQHYVQQPAGCVREWGLPGSAGRADGLRIVTDVGSSWRIRWVMRVPGLRSCGRFRAGAGPQVIEGLAGPWAVVVAEHLADGIDHELGVAGVDVELADVAAVAAGDGDGRLDRAWRDALGLQAQAVEREGGCCLLARRVRRHADEPGVVPAA